MKLPPFLEDRRTRAIIISAVIAFILLVVSAVYTQLNVSKFVTVLPLIILFGGLPYLYYQYNRYQTLKSVEEALPGFLRDITEAHRSGMSLPQSIINASKTEYGKLSYEIKTMASQLSWGVPFPRVLEAFSARMVGSDYIQRAMAIIMEAYRSGGDITEAMESVATNARILKDLEADRGSKLSQQVMIMYVIFFIFLGMLIALHKILTPLFSLQKAGEYGGGSSFMKLSYGPGYYRNLFFNMVMIQAFFNGLLAGQLGEGSVIAGFKHSIIMMTAGLLVFTFLLPEILMSVDITPPEGSIAHGTIYELKGTAMTIEGEPVANSEVLIQLVDIVYRTTTDESGIITYRLKVPEQPGVYDLVVTVIDSQGKKESGKVSLVVS